MTGNDYYEAKSLALETAKEVALSFFEHYKNSPYSKELSTTTQILKLG